MSTVIPFPRAPVQKENPRGVVYIAPDDFDGGCWGVHHESCNGDSGTLIGRYFAFDDALAAAEAWAKRYGCDLDGEGAA